jgi:CheY-like chemotaxis protein
MLELSLIILAFILSVFLYIPGLMIGLSPLIILVLQFALMSWAIYCLYRKNYFSNENEDKMLPFEIEQASQQVNKPSVNTLAQTQCDKPINILLVDDNPSSLIILENILKEKNCKLTVVKSGIEALRELKNKCFDLLILDYSMPDLNGPETLKLADQLMNAIGTMSQDFTSKIPVIEYSSYKENEWSLSSLSYFKLVEKLCKNMPPSQLKSKVDQLLKDNRVA